MLRQLLELQFPRLLLVVLSRLQLVVFHHLLLPIELRLQRQPLLDRLLLLLRLPHQSLLLSPHLKVGLKVRILTRMTT